MGGGRPQLQDPAAVESVPPPKRTCGWASRLLFLVVQALGGCTAIIISGPLHGHGWPAAAIRAAAHPYYAPIALRIGTVVP